MKFVAVGIIGAMKLDKSPEYRWFKDSTFIEEKNKFIPEKLELPIFLQKKIRFQKDEWLNKGFQKHCSTYGYKFKSLTTAVKPVFECLRYPKAKPEVSENSCLRIKDERSLNSNFKWSLPPNLYNIKSHMDESRDHQMGKKGIFKCFTTPRSPKTIIGRHALKYFDDCKTEFYDLPKEMDLSPESDYKFKLNFINKVKKKKAVGDKSFEKSSPGPTDYCPFDREVKLKINKPISMKEPLFFYPSTTVPVHETSFSKIKLFSPGPNRYNANEVVCACHKKFLREQAFLDEDLKELDYKCTCNKLRDISGHGHAYIFNSKTTRLMSAPKSTPKFNLQWKNKILDTVYVPPDLTNRVPLYLRNDDEYQESAPVKLEKVKPLKFHSIIVKQQRISMKSGRPVAFLTAQPRFEDDNECFLLPRRKAKSVTMKKTPTDPSKKKKFSVKRLLELSQHKINPNCPIPDLYGNKLRLYSRLGVSVNTKDGHLNSKKIIENIPWRLSDEDLPNIEADSFFEDSDNLDFELDDGTSTYSSVNKEQVNTILDIEQKDDSLQELPKIQEELQNLEYDEGL